MISKEVKGKISNQKGHFFEKIAKDYLINQGYKIVALNLMGIRGAKVSEIDLIATKDNTLVFFEVKFRKNHQDCYDAITKKTKTKIINSASLFLSKNTEFNNFDIRFDVIFFSNDLKFEHITEAFYA